MLLILLLLLLVLLLLLLLLLLQVKRTVTESGGNIIADVYVSGTCHQCINTCQNCCLPGMHFGLLRYLLRYKSGAHKRRGAEKKVRGQKLWRCHPVGTHRGSAVHVCTLLSLSPEPQGTEWPVRMGRVDSSDGGAAGRIPADDAPIAEIVAFMKQLGAKPGVQGWLMGAVCELWIFLG
jgi:hypothetical protein